MDRVRYWAKLAFLIAVLVFLYSEFLAYSFLSLKWNSLPACVLPNCYKLLLVADPQILGSETNDFGPRITSSIAHWDNDRYLHQTFKKALSHVQPDILVFLGDIMDEGSRSTDEEFGQDLQRFLAIFLLPEPYKNIRVIILPGDNDIGGDDDIMIPQYVHRFDRVFNQSEGPVLLDGLELFKVNFLTFTMQEPPFPDPEDMITRVALSHIPLLPRAGPFVEHVAKKIQPHVIFSAHEHVSSYYSSTSDNTWKRNFHALGPNDTAAKEFRLRSDTIHELSVPTCSYRMGVADMGYGVAVIDTQNRLLRYDVLWLPSRFTHLFAYIAALCALALVVLVCLTQRMRRLCRCLRPRLLSTWPRPFLP